MSVCIPVRTEPKHRGRAARAVRAVAMLAVGLIVTSGVLAPRRADAVLLSTLMNSSNYIDVGDLRFLDFTGYNFTDFSTGVPAIAASDFDVVADPSPPAGELGLEFSTASIFLTPGQKIDISFDFDVEYRGDGTLTDNTLTLHGSVSQESTGYIALSESVTDPNNDDATLANKLAFITSDPSVSNNVDHKDFTYPVSLAHIHKDLSVVAGTGFAHMSDFEQTFSYQTDDQPHPTPEPSTMVLASLGLAGLTFWGWRQRRRRAA